MKQRNTNLVKVFQVDNRKAETLIPLITQNVPAQAEIQSDGWLLQMFAITWIQFTNC